MKRVRVHADPRRSATIPGRLGYGTRTLAAIVPPAPRGRRHGAAEGRHLPARDPRRGPALGRLARPAGVLGLRRAELGHAAAALRPALPRHDEPPPRRPGRRADPPGPGGPAPRGPAAGPGPGYRRQAAARRRPVARPRRPLRP